jgi:hypothetical protein
MASNKSSDQDELNDSVKEVSLFSSPENIGNLGF